MKRSKVDVKYPKISKQRVTQYSVCVVALEWYLEFCANIYHQKIGFLTTENMLKYSMGRKMHENVP